MKHDLKTDPEYFKQIWEDRKEWELRLDDRAFREDDLLRLKETRFSGADHIRGDPVEYTGREIEAVVVGILRGPVYGLEAGWVIMSISVYFKRWDN